MRDDNLIYDCLYRDVELCIPARFGNISSKGYVSYVYRDVLLNKFELWLSDGYVYVFRKPDIMEDDGDDILFRYNIVSGDEFTVKVRVPNGRSVSNSKRRRFRYTKPLLRKEENVPHQAVYRSKGPDKWFNKARNRSKVSRRSRKESGQE